MSENHLTDLSPLEQLPYLISLNASHNQLSSIISSNPPIGLREVNFSYNNLHQIGDLSAHSLLSTLLVEHNEIEEICGIDKCYALSNVSISHNKLTKISGLEALPIKQLDLSYNYIRKIENLQSLKCLQYINLGYNSIRSLRGLQDHELLEDINLRYNQILDPSEVRYLRGLKLLRILNLEGNPIQEINDYRLSILFKIPALMELDVSPVSCEEKVAALNLFKPSMDLTTSADHMGNLAKSYLQPCNLQNSTLPTADPYPMLILIGPLGMEKKKLAQMIVKQFPHVFDVCISHTTRVPSTYMVNGKVFSEENGVHYHFLEQESFEEMKAKGKFVQTCCLFGNHFGVTRESVEKVASKSMACILTMELEGIMSMKRTHFQPRCILVIPDSLQAYKERLSNTNRYTESEIMESVKKVGLYTEIHQQQPGYFDAAILSDEVDETFSQLKNVIEAYLDITPPNTAKESSLHRSSTNNNGLKSPMRLTTAGSSVAFRLDSGSEKVSNTPPASRAMTDSYIRRYKGTKAALTGITSSFQHQLDKIRGAASSAPVENYGDMREPCTASRDSSNTLSVSSDDTVLLLNHE